MTAIEIFCCLAALAAFTSRVEIQCNYITRGRGIVGNLYICQATVINVEAPTIVIDISGIHMEGENNSDVKAFYAYIIHGILTKIPVGQQASDFFRKSST